MKKLAIEDNELRLRSCISYDTNACKWDDIILESEKKLSDEGLGELKELEVNFNNHRIIIEPSSLVTKIQKWNLSCVYKNGVIQ